MPAGAHHDGRTRADRKTLTVPVTADELAGIDKLARAAGCSRAEYVRLALKAYRAASQGTPDASR